MLLIGCRKAEPLEDLTLEKLTTYDLYTATVEQDPSGGFILQCMDGRDGQLSFAQFLDANGSLATPIRYAALPRTIDGLTFTDGSIIFRDIVPLANGNVVVVGLGRDSLDGGSVALHLLTYEVDRSGNLAGIPARQLVSTDARSVRYARSAADDTISVVTPNALGVELDGNAVAVAVAYRAQGAPEDSIALYRLPMPGATEPLSRTAIGSEDGNLEGNQNRLWSLQRRQDQSDRVLLLSGKNDPVVTEFECGAQAISLVAQGRLDITMACVSHFLVEDQGKFLIGGIGNRTTPTASSATPLFTTTDDISTAGILAGYHWLDSLLPLDSPIQCFGATWWNGSVALITNTYPPEVSSFTVDLFSYFNDTECDLGLVVVSPDNGRVIEQSTIVQGHGLRALALFNVNDRLICIGSQNAFYDAQAERTFFMELKRPGS